MDPTAESHHAPSKQPEIIEHRVNERHEHGKAPQGPQRGGRGAAMVGHGEGGHVAMAYRHETQETGAVRPPEHSPHEGREGGRLFVLLFKPLLGLENEGSA